MITALLIGFFGWIWTCMKLGEWIECRTDNILTAGVLTTILFFLPLALFIDFARMFL